MIPQRPGLLVVGRGSGGDPGRAALAELTRQVTAVPGVRDVFAAVGAASLEGGEPTITQSVRLFLEGGCGEVLVAPLLLPVSPALEEDLPGLLGAPVPQHVRQRLVAQGQDVLPSGLPIRLLASLDVAAWVLEAVVHRVASHGLDAAREGTVLCAQGSALYHERWEALMERLCRGLRERGFAYAAHAYVGATVGRSADPAAEAVEAATDAPGVDRAHLVPVLLEPAPSPLRTIAAAAARAAASRPGRVLYAGGALVPDPVFARRLAHAALAAQGLFPGSGEEGLA